MLVYSPIFTRWSNSILVFRRRLLVGLFLLFLTLNRGYSSNQDGSMSQTYSVDWNGTSFLVSGGGLFNSSFPNLSLYENNYYVFNNNSTGEFRFSIGEDNNTRYSDLDVWNNGSYSSDEYLLYSPELNSSRVLYCCSRTAFTTWWPISRIHISRDPVLGIWSLLWGRQRRTQHYVSTVA